ncbi:MAG: segregation/condensation protein A [Planctomycetes bacterium]|nr:segregation/condensation protein A [Planctomycetota bacterium]
MIAHYTVRLERVFQGPMDLLLHLVREQEVEIKDIEIAKILAGYLEYLKALRDLDIELAGEFLVMAATLMSIKSRSLLPRESVDLAQEIDPRDELIQRLIEYRRFKEASDRLGERYELRAQQHERGATGFDVDEKEPELELGELTAWDLLAAFSKLMRETFADRPHRVQVEHRPLRYYVKDMAHRMRSKQRMSLRELFLEVEGGPSRESFIGTFCAMLELVKLGIVGIEQEGLHGEIVLALKQEHAADMDDVLDQSVLDDEAQLAQPEAAATAIEAAVAEPVLASANADDEDDG